MINSLTLNDEDKFRQLGLIINSNFSNLFDLEVIINSNIDYVFGYYDNSDLLGFIHVTKLYETVDIINIVVDKNFRKLGIATKLINYVINKFKDIDSLMLEVNEHNSDAISLYKKNGFKLINIRKGYYDDGNALIMKRDV